MPFQPTWDGLALFGDAVVIRPVPNPPDLQISAFCGVNGVDVLGMGSRGTTLRVTGVVSASSLAGLTTILATWRRYLDVGTAGTGYTVVDTIGNTWNACLLRRWTPTDRLLMDAADPDQLGNLDYAVPYEAEILAPLPAIPPT